MRARVIGYIPMEGQRATGTRISKLLDAARAKSDSDCLKELTIAGSASDHHDVVKHDNDIKAGAVTIVCGLLRSCAPFHQEQIRTCLAILLQLYRCSGERLSASFCTDAAALVPQLMELIEVNYRLGKKGDATSLVLARDVVEKVATGARVPLAMVKQHGRLLSSLVGNVNGVTGRFVMHLSLKIIARLSEHVQNKRFLFSFAGILEATAVGSTHMHESVRDEAVRIVMNLALESKNKTHFIQGNEQYWLDAIVTTITSGSSAAQTSAIQTMGYLASVPENKALMVQHENGIVMDTLISVTSSHAPHQVGVNATKVISSLTCRATASQIGHHPGLLVILSSLALRQDILAPAAALVVKKIATFVRSGDDCHEQILQALVTMSFSRATEVLKWTVKAFYEQSSFPGDRLSMIAHKGLLAALTMLTKDDNDFVRMYAVEVLSSLAIDVATAKNLGVETVLRCVSTSSTCIEHCKVERKQTERKPYSPLSVAQFDFDFAAYFE